MPGWLSEAVNLKVHDEAKMLAREHIRRFATSLMLEAKSVAYRMNAGIVLRHHMDEAHDAIYRQRKRSRPKELVMVMGGAFFGASVQGFVTQLVAGTPVAGVVYTGVGFLGLLLLLWGLRE